ncbi:helix-turn-helix domain-containing protein [Planctobacterium marinum]|uniref:AraC family transcriptional regulator n=1 Tax=Planctobacterium marinum TaxID=1631968 RepID=A0AA48HNQ9_9ALTE|nr:AraC family transcriptional regulator [Planctobacterium marinum]
MDSLTIIQLILLGTTLSLLLAQTTVKQKQTMHLLFALFCGSVAMATAQKLSVGAIGSYGYLLGMGACATCNAYWLLARSLFRKQQALALHHIIFAVALGLLIMLKQGYLFVDGIWQFNNVVEPFAVGILGELTLMFSSCVLLLTIWEGLNGFQQANKTEKRQRILFLFTIISAIVICKTVLSSANFSAQTNQLVVACVSIWVILTTQGLIYWIHQSRNTASEANHQEDEHSANQRVLDKIAARLQALVVDEQQYLKSGLKVADLARQLNVSEYLIGRAIKAKFPDKNFNQYINQLRVEHAKELLLATDKQHWPVLVVGLESGFASVGPFNRAFKTQTGLTPNQYRQQGEVQAPLKCG